MRYILRRIGFFLGTLWAALTLNFVLPRIMPGNPTIDMLARFRQHNITPATLKALAIAFGVNDHEGLVASYFHYLGACLTLHFGTSLTDFPDPVSQVVMQALPYTLGLVGLTTVLSFVLGTVVGIAGAWRRGSWMDNVLPPVFVIASAFPYYFVGMLSLLLFSFTLHWLPFSGGYSIQDSPAWSWSFIWDILQHAFLPALTILVTSIGGWILTMRNTMVTVLAEDYVRMARAKGLSPSRIMFDYAGRNAILPNLTGFAMSLGFVVSGAILVEYVFNYPGVGYILLQATQNEDFPLMQALFLLITMAVLVAVLIADFATAWLDPRTRATA
jgi:peptide/nickel transport system permease protein